jgi:hypothetical protein
MVFWDSLMSLFRRNTIFHVEESLPDPEELKLRVRRRVLLCATVGFLLVLGTPVARDLRQNLHGRAEARRFAERLLEARSLAAASRVPVSLEIEPDRQGWQQIFYTAGEGCTTEAPGPRSRYSTEGVFWKVQAQQDDGTAVGGHRLCWHPSKGLMLDSTPLDHGKLLVSLSTTTEEGTAPQELASVLITQGGAEMQTISY